MAPEQLAGDGASAHSDQFAFCVSLFEALHGERPFEAVSTSGLRAAIARGPRPGRKPIPARVQRVIDHGLAVNPSRRAATMDDVVRALEAALVRPRITWIVGAVAIVATAASAALVLGHHADPCRSAHDGLDGTWDPSIRQAVHAAFTASGLESSALVFARVTTGLDAYARRWTAQRVGACEATEVHHAQSPALLDLRMQCLDRRRAELAGLVGTWRGTRTASWSRGRRVPSCSSPRSTAAPTSPR